MLMFNWVRDHLPLKQGLRLVLPLYTAKVAVVRDHLPLKQGLRREFFIAFSWFALSSETIFH